VENTPLPHSMLLVCSSRSQQLQHNIVWREGGLKGQARGEERDHSDEIGGKKGECVNNFVADCSNECELTSGTLLALYWCSGPGFSSMSPLRERTLRDM